MKLAIRLARQSLRSHKLRSRLSTIGIVISVFIISLIFIISDSLKTSLANQASVLNSDSIIVNGANSNRLLNLVTTLPGHTLLADDADAIQNRLSGSHVVSNLILNGSASFDDTQLSNVTTVATSTVSPDDLHLTMLDGGWFSDNERDKKWVILGENLANQLIGTSHPQSQIVDIKGEKFTVVGVVQRVNQPLSVLGYDVDNTAFISLENGQSLADSDNLSQLIVTNVDNVDDAKLTITKALAGNHPDDDDYTIDTASSIAERLTELVNYITIAACGVSGLILLISCISIANIMLVNITERRREIGIRKAVGATTRNIMGQFIAESLIMSLRGGIIGILLAYGVAAIILLFMSVNLTFSWLALAVGFVVPVIVGIIAGVYPAYRASRQNIIEALNQLT